MNFLKTENFCASKYNIKKLKNNPQKERKYKQYISYMKLIYKEFLQLNNKGKNNPIKSGQRI